MNVPSEVVISDGSSKSLEGITGVKTGRFNVRPHLENGGMHPTESGFGKLELAITTQAAAIL